MILLRAFALLLSSTSGVRAFTTTHSYLHNSHFSHARASRLAAATVDSEIAKEPQPTPSDSYDAIFPKPVDMEAGLEESLEVNHPKENDIFECDENARFWEDRKRGSAQDNLREVASIASDFAQKGPDGLAYWAKHAGRSSYFAGNALLGLFASSLHERLVKRDEQGPLSALPWEIDSEATTGILVDTFLSYQQDYQAIEAGVYREPWDMKLGHRQSSPLNVLTQTSRFVNEAIGTLGRRKRGEQQDKDIWISSGATSDLYPDYYRNAFHYQTDGWMSQKSANVYETSTETLFLGRQDAMQRTSLKPLVELSKKVKSEGRLMRILEVACGTGRFMTFIRDNMPLDTEYTAVDLSPYYLDAARENDKYWRSTRKNEEEQGGSGTVTISPAKIVQAQAEQLPFEGQSFDAVVCVYLFHELPRDVRAQAAAEMARVVAPGGTVVLTDSTQLGDRPALDGELGKFGDMNEPYYRDYIQDFTAGHFQAAGLEPVAKTVRSTTKSLSFTKN